MKKNQDIHTFICRFHVEKNQAIKTIMATMRENYDYYQEQSEKASLRKKKDTMAIS